jgi:hypothetical protein
MRRSSRPVIQSSDALLQAAFSDLPTNWIRQSSGSVEHDQLSGAFIDDDWASLGPTIGAQSGTNTCSFTTNASAPITLAVSSGTVHQSVMRLMYGHSVGTAMVTASGGLGVSVFGQSGHWQSDPVAAFATVGVRRTSVNTESSLYNVSYPEAEWLNDALRSLEQLAGAADNGASPVAFEMVERSKEIIRICASFDVPEPVSDFDDEGNIEIFFKRSNSGILLVLAASGVLQIFGTNDGDKWRGRYDMSGNTWKAHLRSFVAELSV